MGSSARVRDVIVGAAAGAVGTVAMDEFFKALARVRRRLNDGNGARASSSDAGSPNGGSRSRERPLDDISLTGIESREGESSPATLARAAYEKVTGREPPEETRDRLATGIHWGMGLGMGALYGALRGRRADGLDLGGGAAFGTGVWAVADELAVPLLGLSKGPTATGMGAQLKGLGAHLVYGLATAAAAQTLERIV